ncbi:MAG: hypothetical protein IKC09_02550 [Oscillospiraceae bacterium]|nr:hypothetical protein [Oscillospiraceae bacterium]MBR2889140.1 hypothetical protein [Oscillospiraceae bacterium]
MAFYSDVTMPARPGYNLALYPHAVAELRYPIGAEQWSEVAVYYSPMPFLFDSGMGCVTNSEEVCRFQVYDRASGSWSGEQQRGGPPVLIPGMGEQVFRRIWSEQLLADEQARVWLKAGAFTPRDWKGLESWMAGLLQGLNRIPFRADQTALPEPEALYSYNSMILPGLPETVSGERYVIICWVPGEQCYRVVAGETARYRAEEKKLRNASTGTFVYWFADYRDGAWGEPWSQTIRNSSYITSYEVEPVWCNLDLPVQGTGEILVPGSAPVPVVRVNPNVRYDPAVWMLGLLLGQQISRQRPGREVTL